MSTRSSTSTVSTDAEITIGSETFRRLALGGILLLTASYVAALREVTMVVGGTRTLLAIVVLMLAGATFLARTIGLRTATVGAIAVAVVGFWYYLAAVGLGLGYAVSAADKFLSDTIALATGLPIIRMVEAGLWSIAFAPGPAFLSWYLALRRRYVLSVLPGGIALLFLVLTGDAGPGLTLIGTVGGISAVGFGELERRDGTLGQADVLAVLFAVMIVLSLTVTLIPGGSRGPEFLVENEHDGTLEGSLTAAPDRSAIAGEVELSPEVRFTVRSEEPSYWRVGVYDRFTGGQWIRTGQEVPYEGGSQLPAPEGRSETVRQTVYVEDDAAVMPAAPQPIRVEGDAAENTMLTSHGQIRPDQRMIEGDVYNVESAVLDDSPENLRGAGTTYPDEVEERYLQTPESLSSDFSARTSEVVGDADDPYDKAVAIEQHLRESKEYSLNVSRPDGNVADEFLLEMDEGYCVYFATTMVQMLRDEGVPARYAVGYTTGQQVDDNEWVVRGLNAHAWVEVYFPEKGWVAFDPTPSDPRDDDRADRIEEARDEGETRVDTDRSQEVPATGSSSDGEPFDDPDGPAENGSSDGNDSIIPGIDDPRNPDQISGGAAPGGAGNISPGSTGADNDTDGENESNESAADPSDDDGPFSPENALLGVAVLLGLAAGAHRTGATGRANRAISVHWQGFGRTPEQDAERAFRRLELLLERRYRPRGRAESPRQYLTALSNLRSFDPRARRVGRIYERAVYGHGVDREEADEAIAIVDEMARERLPVVGRFWR